MQQSNYRRLAIRLLILGAATLVLLEISLQALSYAAFRWTAGKDSTGSAEEETAELGERLLYCVGDSFTFGYGSSDAATRSYPAQLVQLLEEGTGERWKAVNLGHPGNNTKQMAESLARKVHEQSPDLVILLGGINDIWSRPSLVTGLDADSVTPEKPGFRWEYRTGRLLKTFRSVRPYEGRQNDDRGAASAPVPVPVAADAAPDKPAFDSSLGKGERAWQLANERKFEEAIALFEESGWSAETVATGLVYCYAHLGSAYADQIESQVEIVRTMYADDPSLQNAVALFSVLEYSHRNEELLEVGREITNRFSEDFSLAARYGHVLLLCGQPAEARVELDRALSLLRPENASEIRRISFWTSRLTAYGSHAGLEPDPEEKFFAAIRAMEVHGGPPRAADLQNFLHAADGGGANLEAAIARSELTAETEKRVRTIYEQSLSESAKADAMQITEDNYVAMAEFARSNGAKTLICSYPFNAPELTIAGKQASQRARSLFLQINDDFEERWAEKGMETYFVADGHCNDAGYRLMAELMAKKLLPILSSSGVEPPRP